MSSPSASGGPFTVTPTAPFSPTLSSPPASSTSLTSTDSTSSLLEAHPWIWVIFPLLLILVVSALGVVLRVKRTQNRRAAAAAAEARLAAMGLGPDTDLLDPAARAELRSHLERAGRHWASPDIAGPGNTRVVGLRTPGGITVTTVPRGWGRPGGAASGTRWAWANGFYAPHHRAPEEGLNELGEAPPPYMGGKADEEGETVPMQDLQRAPTRASAASGESASSPVPVAEAPQRPAPAVVPTASPASPISSPPPPPLAQTTAAPSSPPGEQLPDAPAYVQPPPYTGGPRTHTPRTSTVDPLEELMRPRSVAFARDRTSR